MMNVMLAKVLIWKSETLCRYMFCKYYQYNITIDYIIIHMLQCTNLTPRYA